MVNIDINFEFLAPNCKIFLSPIINRHQVGLGAGVENLAVHRTVTVRFASVFVEIFHSLHRP
jgi:hypothetical protein